MDNLHDLTFKPGEEVPESGIYAQYNDQGGYVGEATCVKGEPFPPTQHAGGYWRIHIQTDKHHVNDVTVQPPAPDAPAPVLPEQPKMALNWKAPTE